MKFKEYIINESMPIDTAIDMIKKKCGPFYKDFTSFPFVDFLYSGRKEDTDIIERPIRTNRYSMNTPRAISNEFDTLFFQKFKVRPRSGGLFCIANEEVASSYGTSYIIFPVGQYKILYSDIIDDLFISISKWNLKEMYKKEPDKAIEKMKKMVNSYKIGDLKGAIKSDNEVMIVAKSYIGFKVDTYMSFEKVFDK